MAEHPPHKRTVPGSSPGGSITDAQLYFMSGGDILPEFDGKNVSIAEVAVAIGKSALYVRHGIVSGRLPIGHCQKSESGKRTNFYISPKLLYEVTGIVAKDGRIVGKG